MIIRQGVSACPGEQIQYRFRKGDLDFMMQNLGKRLISFFLVCACLVTVLQPVQTSASQKQYLIKVNRRMCVVTIYEQDSKGKFTVPVKAMLCSPGWDTPLGTFYTPQKYRWKLLKDDVWGQYSTRITTGILFHSVWYYEQDPSTLSIKQFNKLGTICSHGCVRLDVKDVKWIYDNCGIGTKVVIYDSDNPGPLGKPKAIKINSSAKMGYDPTDIWTQENPYNKKVPVISGVKNKTIYYGKTVNLMSGVKGTSAYGDNITGSVSYGIRYKGNAVKKVNTKKAGNYYVTYKVTDLLGRSTSKRITVKVVDNIKASITCPSWIYTNNTNLSNVLKEKMTASWHGEDVSSLIKRDVEVLNTLEGATVSRVTLSVTTDNKLTVKKKVTVVQDTQAPTLTGVKETLVLLPEEITEEKLLEGVLPQDNYSKSENCPIVVTMTPQEDGSTIVVYTVTDRCGNSAEYQTILNPVTEGTQEVVGE